jgi:DnaK suppressor protein
MATTTRWVRTARPPVCVPNQGIEQSLRREHSSLRASTAALREGVPAEASTVRDVLDQAKHAAEQSVGLAMLEVSSRRVREVEAALRRLRAGSYGTCADCSDRISRERLRALPCAVLCRDCQEQHDAAAAAAGPTKVGWDETFSHVPLPSRRC